MSHLILTGATGLVGSAALAHVLSLPAGNITKLSILSRRPVPMADGEPNVEVLIQKDFSTFEPDVLARLKGADGCIWAQVSPAFFIYRYWFISLSIRKSLTADLYLGNLG